MLNSLASSCCLDTQNFSTDMDVTPEKLSLCNTEIDVEPENCWSHRVCQQTSFLGHALIHAHEAGTRDMPTSTPSLYLHQKTGGRCVPNVSKQDGHGL
eukprot:c13800_g1_i1 orf=17-310(+)